MILQVLINSDAALRPPLVCAAQFFRFLLFVFRFVQYPLGYILQQVLSAPFFVAAQINTLTFTKIIRGVSKLYDISAVKYTLAYTLCIKYAVHSSQCPAYDCTPTGTASVRRTIRFPKQVMSWCHFGTSQPMIPGTVQS